MAGKLTMKDIDNINCNIIEQDDLDVHSILKMHNIFNRPKIDLNNALDAFIPMSDICYASRKNSYVIRPDGSVYKCTVHFDDKNNKVGYFDDNGNMIINEYSNAKWYIKNEFRKICIECIFLPICGGGGCTYYTNIIKPGENCLSKDLKKNLGSYLCYISKCMKFPYLPGGVKNGL